MKRPKFFKSTFILRHIILISIDTCRVDFLSCYGYQQKTTPNIDKLARQSVLFENVISASPLTLPSHSTMLTGTIPPYHGVHSNTNYRLGKFNVTLAEMLQKKGYKTAAVIGEFVLDAQFGLSQGFDSYNDRFGEKRQAGFERERRAAEVSELGINWLAEHANEDFFLFLHYFDPHAEYIPPEPFASDFPGNPYLGEIAYTDYCIGKVIEKLKDMGIYDSALVIITGDHGESFGQHGEYTHGYFVYNTTIKVPLIVKLPESNNTKRIKDIVGLLDVTPTILSQLDINIPAYIRGKDLSDYFRQKSVPRQNRFFYCESLIPTMVNCNSLYGMVDSDGFKYIQTTRPELYDLKKDPDEKYNLLDKKPQKAKLLKKRLKEIFTEQHQARPDDSKFLTDQQSIERLRGLGYLGGSVNENTQFDSDRDDPKDFVALFNKIVDMLMLRTKGQYHKAKTLCKEILNERPGLAQIHTVYGVMLYRAGNFEGTLYHYRQAVENKAEHNADNAMFHCNLANILAKLGKTDEAVSHYAASLKANPNYAQSHCNLAIVLVEKGQKQEAMGHFRKAMQINPKDPEAYYRLAEILTEQGKTDEAIKLAEFACKKTGYKNPGFLNALAAAYARAGRNAQAIETAQKALTLARWAGQTGLAAQIQSRLDRYMAGQFQVP